MTKQKIGLYGIGAIGSVISFMLKEENDFLYFNRSKKNKIEICTGNTFESKNVTLSKVSENINLDWLIICLKEYHFIYAEKDFQTLIKGPTRVAIIRNGIDLKEPLLKYTKEEKIVECIIDCPTELNAQGHYCPLKKPTITVPDTPLSSAFKSLFLLEKIDIIISSDFKTEIWKKLIESSALGGILALSGESCWIFKDVAMCDLFVKIAQEGVEVAIADGAKIKDSFLPILQNKITEYPDSKTSSMLSDRLKGNPIEIQAKNGAISSMGKKHQINTPLNDLIFLLLKHTNNKTKN